MQVVSLRECPKRNPGQQGSTSECPWLATLRVTAHICADRNRHVLTTPLGGHLDHTWIPDWTPPHVPLPFYCSQPEP